MKALAVLVVATVTALPSQAEPTAARVRITPHDRPIELSGQFTPEGRSAEEARSKPIVQRVNGPTMTGADVAHCVILLVVCPVTLLLATAVGGTVGGIRRQKAAARASRLLVPEQRAGSLSAMIQEQATSIALAERASQFDITRPSANGAETEPHLVVRMKTVETFDARRKDRLGIRVFAEAQAFPSRGVALQPTLHVHARVHGPLSAWSGSEDEFVRQVLQEALDVLAASIASTYSKPWDFAVEEQK